MQSIQANSTSGEGIRMNRSTRKLRLKMNSPGNDEFGKWMCCHWAVRWKEEEKGRWFMKMVGSGDKQGKLSSNSDSTPPLCTVIAWFTAGAVGVGRRCHLRWLHSCISSECMSSKWTGGIWWHLFSKLLRIDYKWYNKKMLRMNWWKRLKKTIIACESKTGLLGLWVRALFFYGVTSNLNHRIKQ